MLRDAFNYGWRVHFDHEITAGKTKGTIVRMWLTKDAPTTVGQIKDIARQQAQPLKQ